MPPVLRSIFAIIAGFVVMSITSAAFFLLSGVVLHAQSPQTGSTSLASSIIFRLLSAVVGGLIAGFVAPSRPVLHGCILATIMLIAGAFSFAHYRGPLPLWFQLLMVLAGPACAVAGAALSAHSRLRPTV